VVTFWQSVSEDGDQFASTPEIAAILAALHRLTVATQRAGYRPLLHLSVQTPLQEETGG
jgi:hypothetical protein